MFAAREDQSLPKGYGNMLLGLHDKKPFPVTPDEIAALAREVRDRNFRIEAAADGIHIYNRDGHHIAKRRAVALPKARRRSTTARMPSISAPS